MLLSTGEGNITLKAMVKFTCISLPRSDSNAHWWLQGKLLEGMPKEGGCHCQSLVWASDDSSPGTGNSEAKPEILK